MRAGGGTNVAVAKRALDVLANVHFLVENAIPETGGTAVWVSRAISAAFHHAFCALLGISHEVAQLA